MNPAPPVTRRLFNLRLKILLAMGVVALTVMAAFLVPGIVLRRQGVVEEFQTFVRSAAGTAALALSGDDLARIKTNADAATPEFQRVRAILESVRKINHLTEREVYILRPLDAAGSTEFVAMLQAQTFIGDRYTIRAENRAAFLAGWSSGEPTATAPYRDEHGEWISGYAPIFDRAARLCEKAAPWEILVTDAFLATLDPAARAAFHQTAPIAFKNVQQAVTTHSLTTEWATA